MKTPQEALKEIELAEIGIANESFAFSIALESVADRVFAAQLRDERSCAVMRKVLQ